MEELLIKVKNEKDSSFIKTLLEKLGIQFETLHTDGTELNEEVKQSVIAGQTAYQNGDRNQFAEIDRNKLWK